MKSLPHLVNFPVLATDGVPLALQARSSRDRDKQFTQYLLFLLNQLIDLPFPCILKPSCSNPFTVLLLLERIVCSSPLSPLFLGLSLSLLPFPLSNHALCITTCKLSRFLQNSTAC